LDESMTLKEFNTRVANDPSYPMIAHLQGYRIMVIVPGYKNYESRQYADVVLFYSHGLVKVEMNKFGPPGQTYPLERINIYELLRAVGSRYVVILPPTATPPPRHCPPLGGIVVDQGADSSGVHCPNPDNEYNNPDFINRK
jgi:hypothetical protein